MPAAMITRPSVVVIRTGLSASSAKSTGSCCGRMPISPSSVLRPPSTPLAHQILRSTATS